MHQSEAWQCTWPTSPASLIISTQPVVEAVTVSVLSSDLKIRGCASRVRHRFFWSSSSFRASDHPSLPSFQRARSIGQDMPCSGAFWPHTGKRCSGSPAYSHFAATPFEAAVFNLLGEGKTGRGSKVPIAQSEPLYSRLLFSGFSERSSKISSTSPS
jgi:hypothetical protein